MYSNMNNCTYSYTNINIKIIRLARIINLIIVQIHILNGLYIV